MRKAAFGIAKGHVSQVHWIHVNYVNRIFLKRHLCKKNDCLLPHNRILMYNKHLIAPEKQFFQLKSGAYQNCQPMHDTLFILWIKKHNDTLLKSAVWFKSDFYTLFIQSKMKGNLPSKFHFIDGNNDTCGFFC